MLSRRLASLSRPLLSRAACAPAAVFAVRNIHVSAPVRLAERSLYEESRYCSGDSNHSTMWKQWRKTGVNGALVTGEGEWRDGLIGLELNPEVVPECLAKAKYLLDVLNTMDRCFYKEEMTKLTQKKIDVLSSSMTQDEMEAALDLGPLEEVMAHVLDELDLIKHNGKEFFVEASHPDFTDREHGPRQVSPEDGE